MMYEKLLDKINQDMPGLKSTIAMVDTLAQKVNDESYKITSDYNSMIKTVFNKDKRIFEKLVIISKLLANGINVHKGFKIDGYSINVNMMKLITYKNHMIINVAHLIKTFESSGDDRLIKTAKDLECIDVKSSHEIIRSIQNYLSTSYIVKSDNFEVPSIEVSVYPYTNNRYSCKVTLLVKPRSNDYDIVSNSCAIVYESNKHNQPYVSIATHAYTEDPELLSVFTDLYDVFMSRFTASVSEQMNKYTSMMETINTIKLLFHG